jgi:alpha-amylase/alpha-mannosidase (GH57 family)
MKYVAIFHGNLNYAYLTPDKYEFVIRKTYELIFDTMREEFPGTKYVFEASGYTLEQIAVLTPDVLEKLKAAITSGQCEFMGSPYAHPMLPNFPKEDGQWSIRFSNESYQKHLGILPASFWNPECGWRSYVPEQAAEEGYKNIIGDFEAYSRSLGTGGTPQRPEIYEKEYSKDPAFYSFAFKYDLPGSEKAIHFPFQHLAGLPDGKLRMFLRTDRVAQFAVRFFMGMEGYSFEKYLGLIKQYSEQPAGEPEGALIIFADDAEYIGTNGWFRLKFQNKPDNVFEETPTSRENLINLITEVKKLGEFISFNDACNKLPALPETITFDDDAAWHGAKASTWANTPMARLLRPWQDLVREKIHTLANTLDQEILRKAWYHLTNSYNSDGQWPPTLPNAPHIIHPFNYGYCFENLLKAELLVGGVDRSKLSANPVETMKEILSIQQNLVAEKAETLLRSGTQEEKTAARLAQALITTSRDLTSLRQTGSQILYSEEYRIRAELLVEARRLVGGVVLEKVE